MTQVNFNYQKLQLFASVCSLFQKLQIIQNGIFLPFFTCVTVTSTCIILHMEILSIKVISKKNPINVK